MQNTAERLCGLVFPLLQHCHDDYAICKLLDNRRLCLFQLYHLDITPTVPLQHLQHAVSDPYSLTNISLDIFMNYVVFQNFSPHYLYLCNKKEQCLDGFYYVKHFRNIVVNAYVCTFHYCMY